MARAFKWLGIGVAAVVALILALVVAVMLLVDPNDYRERIAQVVEAQTGRALTIEGDLGLTFFPRIGLTVGEARLADAPGFGEEPFFAIESAQLAVQVMPLLGGELRLDTIVLQRPEIRLVVNAEGKGNWETLGPGGQASTEAPPARLVAVSNHGAGAGAGPLPAIVRELRLDGILVRDARIVYDDRATGTQATVDPFNLTLNDVQFGEPIAVEADWQAEITKAPAIRGDLTAAATVAADLSRASIADLVVNATATGDAVPGGSQQATVRADVEAALNEAVYRVTGLEVDAAGAQVTGNAEVAMGAQGPVATGTLAIPETNPRDVLEQLAIEIPPPRDDSALTNLRGSTDFRFAGGRLALQPLNLVLDDSTLGGQVSVRDFAGPAVDFELALDRIDVDRYLPPPAEGETEKAATPGGAAAAGAAELPVEPLRALDLNGHLTVGELKVSGARASAIDVTVTAKDGRIRVHPLTADLYGGQYAGDVRMDATGEEVVVSLNEKLTGIQANPLLTDLVGFDKLLGQGSFSLEANTRGGEVNRLLKTLVGTATFEFANGAVKGINVAQLLRQGLARVRGAETAAADEQATDFTRMAGSVTIDNGVARNRDLDIKTPLLRITGDGSANLIEQTLDYNLVVNIVGSLEGQGGADLEQLRGVPVPLRFTGSFADPKIELGIAEALKAKAGARVEQEKEKLEQQVEEKKQELREKAGEKVEEQLQDKLKGLFN